VIGTSVLVIERRLRSFVFAVSAGWGGGGGFFLEKRAPGIFLGVLKKGGGWAQLGLVGLLVF